MSLRPRSAKPTPVYIPGLPRKESAKRKRRRVLRPLSREELHPDSVLSEATLAMIDRGEIQFQWQLVAQTSPRYSTNPKSVKRREARRRRRLRQAT